MKNPDSRPCSERTAKSSTGNGSSAFFQTEPCYVTVLPVVQPHPEKPPKPKGILKKAKESFKGGSTSNGRRVESLPVEEDVKQFSLDINEQKLYDTNEENVAMLCDPKTPVIQTHESPQSATLLRHSYLGSKDDINDTLSSRRGSEPANPSPPGNQIPQSLYAEVIKASKMEAIAGVMHLIVIIASITTLISLARLTSYWELELRCPLFVKVPNDYGAYWGNDDMRACYYVAYMPTVLLVMSFSFILLHGGILISWRGRHQTYKLMISKAYLYIIFCIEILEMIIAITIVSVIADGLRQTCLSFQLNPWTEERPANCKEGFKEKDHVYGISNTYTKIIIGLVASIISLGMLAIACIVSLIRIDPCKRK